MPVALITGAARANSIAAGIVPRLREDGWTVATSDVTEADYPCDLSSPDAPDGLLPGVGDISAAGGFRRLRPAPAISPTLRMRAALQLRMRPRAPSPAAIPPPPAGYADSMRSRFLAVPVAALAVVFLAGCSAVGSSPETADADAAASDTCEYVAGGPAARDVDAPPAEPAQSGTVSATLQTSAGDIPLSLDADSTPCTVGSFVSLAEQGYYSDTTCHRLTTSGIYVLQCGDPSATGMGGPGYSYADELDGSETYPAGTLAMANAGPNTNGSQFFLVYEDTELPPSYTVFGQMDADGLAVVQQIAADGAEGGAADGPPATPVTITGVTIG